MSDTRDRVDTAVGAVLFNASNFPERVKVHVLGQNMGPLREKITVAVLAALGLCACVEDVVCGTCMTSDTPPAGDVREAAQTFAEHVGWSWNDLEPIWQEAFAQAAQKVLVRPRGTVTEAKVSVALDSYLDGAEPLDWQPGAMRAALKAAMEDDS